MSSNHQSDFDRLPDTAFVRQAQLVPHVLPFSASHLWRRVKNNTFPAPVKLSERCTAWRVSDIRAWLKDPTAKLQTSTGTKRDS